MLTVPNVTFKQKFRIANVMRQLGYSPTIVEIIPTSAKSFLVSYTNCGNFEIGTLSSHIPLVSSLFQTTPTYHTSVDHPLAPGLNARLEYNAFFRSAHKSAASFSEEARENPVPPCLAAIDRTVAALCLIVSWEPWNYER